MPASQRMVLLPLKREELQNICSMEQGDAREFIIPYSLERHLIEFVKPNVIYRSIQAEGEMVGFIILVLDSDAQSVEFRRIVVSKPGRGYGRMAVELVNDICVRELGRSQVWLDVFENNQRARHLYEKCGYRQFGRSEHKGRTLLLYEREAYRIREAREQDCTEIARLASQLGYPASSEVMRLRLQRLLNGSSDVVFVGETNPGSELIGWIQGSLAQYLESDYRVEIAGLIVDERFRGNGIGGSLVTRIERWATERGVVQASVRCRTTRPEAHLFYESLGYTPAKTQVAFRKPLPHALNRPGSEQQ